MDAYIPGRITDAGLLKKFRKSSGLSKSVSQTLIFRFTGMVLVFILQLLLAGWMGPKHYGDYAVILTVINLFIGFSMCGFDSSVRRLMHGYISDQDYPKARGLAKFSYRAVALVSVIFSVTIFVFLVAKSKKFNIGFSEGLFWAMLMIPFLAVMHQASAILHSLNRIKTSMLPLFYFFPVLMAAGCAYYYSSHQKLSVDAAMLINLGCTILMFFYIRRKASSALNDQAPTDKVVYERRKWLPVSALLFLTTALDLLMKQTDVLMISYYMGNTHAGFYAVAVRLALFAGIGLAVTDHAFMPKMLAFFNGKQLIKLQQYVVNSSLQVLSISLPVALLLFISGKWILGFFGAAFASAYVPLIILLISQIINSAMGMTGALMMISGHQKTFFLFYMLAFIAQIALNIALIPTMGMTGAAIGSTLSCIILNFFAYRFIKGKMKIKASFFN